MNREHEKLLAEAVCIADGQDPAILATTYNGRQRMHDYKRFALAAVDAYQKILLDSAKSSA